MSPIAAYFVFMARENERELAWEREPVRVSRLSLIARGRSALAGLRDGSRTASPAAPSGGSAA